MKRVINTKQFIIIIIFFSSAKLFSQWTNISPNLPGRMSSILASKTDPNVLLAASPGGGVWKTLNNGATWEPTLNYGLWDYTVADLQWDKFQSNRILASTASALYASTDFGDHWTCLTPSCGFPSNIRANQGPTFERKGLAQLSYNYSSAANTTFWSTPMGGFYYSNNGGSFTQYFPFAGGFNNLDNDISAFAVDNNTGFVYIASSNTGNWQPKVFRSETAWSIATTTMNWIPINYTTTARGCEVTSIVSTPEANKLAFTFAYSASVKVFRTFDGLSWEEAAQPSGTVASWDPRVLYSPSANQLFLGCNFAYYSNDFGSTWAPMYSTNHADINSFYASSYSGNNYIWFTTDGSLITGAGTQIGSIERWNYTPSASVTPTFDSHIQLNGLKTWQIHYIEAINVKSLGLRLFIGSHDNNTLISNNNGITWQREGAPPYAADSYYMSIAKTSPEAYTFKDNGIPLYKSQKTLNAGSISNPTWLDLTSFTSSNSTQPLYSGSQRICVDPTNSQRFCVVEREIVKYSSNGGVNVYSLTALPNNANPTCVFLDTDGSIYIGTLNNGVYYSNDNGNNWNNFALNSNSPKLITKILHTDYGPAGGTFYIATSNGLYTRSGSSFKLVTPYGYLVSDVEAHPTQSNKIYVGYGYGDGFIKHGNGVMYSINGGQTFSSLSSGYPVHSSPISDIKIDPVNNNIIYVATYGLGLWKYQ